MKGELFLDGAGEVCGGGGGGGLLCVGEGGGGLLGVGDGLLGGGGGA